MKKKSDDKVWELINRFLSDGASWREPARRVIKTTIDYNWKKRDSQNPRGVTKEIQAAIEAEIKDERKNSKPPDNDKVHHT